MTVFRRALKTFNELEALTATGSFFQGLHTLYLKPLAM